MYRHKPRIVARKLYEHLPSWTTRSHLPRSPSWERSIFSNFKGLYIGFFSYFQQVAGIDMNSRLHFLLLVDHLGGKWMFQWISVATCYCSRHQLYNGFLKFPIHHDASCEVLGWWVTNCHLPPVTGFHWVCQAIVSCSLHVSTVFECRTCRSWRTCSQANEIS